MGKDVENRKVAFILDVTRDVSCLQFEVTIGLRKVDEALTSYQFNKDERSESDEIITLYLTDRTIRTLAGSLNRAPKPV